MSVSKSFFKLVGRIQPRDTEIANARRHAAAIQIRLKANFRVRKFLIVGSYSRHTYIHNKSDIDLFVVVSRDDARWGSRYVTSDTMLNRFKDELERRYPNTIVYRDIHAIRVFFSATGIGVDLVPAFFEGMTDRNWPLYQMPDGSGDWMRTSPELHNAYIKQGDQKSGGKLRRAAQLVKFWRECRTPRVPLSSFHIEMLLVSRDICSGIKSYAQCMTEIFQVLAQRQCQALRDPLGIAGYIGATRSQGQRESALRSVIHSRDHAKDALLAEDYGDTYEAKRQWDIVFNDKFPW